MSDQGEHDPWADGDDLPAADDPWAEEVEDDPWADEPDLLADDPAAWASAIQTFHDAVAAAPAEWRAREARDRAADVLRAFARRYGLLAETSSGAVYGIHLARPTKRLGSTHDPAGEHCWMVVVTGEGAGVSYRTPIAGGPAWRRQLDAADLDVARRAPHIKTSLGIA